MKQALQQLSRLLKPSWGAPRPIIDGDSLGGFQLDLSGLTLTIDTDLNIVTVSRWKKKERKILFEGLRDAPDLDSQLDAVISAATAPPPSTSV